MSVTNQKVDGQPEAEIDELGLETETETTIMSNDGSSFVQQPPFDPAKIDIVTQPRSIDVLLSRLKYGEMDLSPDFQRHANLWGDDRKTALIESILLKIPIPSLYVSEDQDGNYAVVDGLQRMSAIAHFVNVDALNDALKLEPKENLKSLALNIKGLRSFQDLEGKTFKELERPLQRRILEAELTVHVIRAGTPGAVKFNIFSRINQGGLPLTAQEIRNAIYPGRWREKIRQLVDNDEFKQATEGKIKAKRMEDMELMLRAVALHHQHEPRPNDQNLEDYLNDFVEKVCQHWDEVKWASVSKHIKAALSIAPIIFGEYVFRKYYRAGEKRKPINRGLFEAQIGVLSRYGEEQSQTLLSRKDYLLKQFIKLSDSTDSSNPLHDPSILDEIRFEFSVSQKQFFEIQRDFEQAVTFVTSKGLASNKRVEGMEYIFNEVLKADSND